MYDFKNKNIIITGASKGLGKVIAIEFEKLSRIDSLDWWIAI